MNQMKKVFFFFYEIFVANISYKDKKVFGFQISINKTELTQT